MSKVLAVPVVLVLTLAGCGDSGGSRSGDSGSGRVAGDAPASLTKQEYLVKADAICATANKQEAALRPGQISWHYTAKFQNERWLARFAAIGRDALRRWRALPLPSADRAQAEAALAGTTRMLGAMRAQVAALREGHSERTAQNADEYDAGWTDLVAAGGQFGFTECLNLGV